MGESSFKAIIVGGGPVGLVAAHALEKANIDFVVLENKADLSRDVGASVVIGPQNLRVMNQLGVYGRLLGIGSQLRTNKSFLLNGYKFKQNNDLLALAGNHGVGYLAFHRAELVRELYESLSDGVKRRYFTNKKVINIESLETGVKVTTSDGNVFEGSIVIGADGVHSVTRNTIRKLALEENPGTEWDPKDPFPAIYRCMWCSFPPPEAPGANYEATSKDKSAMFLTSRDRGWILTYDKFPEPTTERHTYTEKDVEAFAANIAEFPVNETLKVKDVFAKRQTWGMSDLGEGVLKHWYWKRIVLAGDSCHKYTPNAGLGLNNGIQDIVVLSNELQKAVRAQPTENISTEALEQIFKTYQEARREPAIQDCNQSAMVTRVQTWASWFHYLLSRFIFARNFVGWLMRRYVVSPAIRQASVFDFIPAKDLPAGTVSWVHPVPNLESD
ncbi:unnamed protein product [Clonostachys rhizophaga]|uniref:FAD-binding domain-containing protein n=1 Tax=Clonostachys rhizophaga TaxID=160324 RepID=A0A9N9V9V2_9HYPO|nr:unnamed protein product [Clonostachys rhizophaga]